MTIGKSSDFWGLWFNKIMAMFALISYLLVLFDMTYLPLRDFWLQGKVQASFKTPIFNVIVPDKPLVILPENIRKIVSQYDWVKGIEPHRDTSQYLQTVAQLNAAVAQGEDRQEIDSILQDLQTKSVAMIENNPFIAAGKGGVLEAIKNSLRIWVFGDKNASAKAAFQQFWTWENLSSDYEGNLNFFNRKIKPLLEDNYFRSVGENGLPEDQFIVWDFPFTLLFFGEFLVRTFTISRRYRKVSWLSAMFWRWYDVLLFLPFWRWLRIIPLIIRLNQAELINLNFIQKKVNQGFAVAIAKDVTEVVVVELIDQLQEIIRQGGIEDILSRTVKDQYIDLNNINEISEIVKLVSEVIFNKILPRLRPDIEVLLKYNIQSSLSKSSALVQLQKLPGLKNLENQLSHNISKQIYQVLANILQGFSKDDPNYEQLVEGLTVNFRETFAQEFKAKPIREPLEFLIIDFLEELKINYIQRLSPEDMEVMLEESKKRAIAKSP